MHVRLLAILLLTFFLGSCQHPGTWGYVEPTESDTSNGIGYVLVGMPEPPGTAIFYAGQIEHGRFHESIWTRATYSGIGEDGFVLFKAPAGTTVALTEFEVNGFTWFKTGAETKIPVFTVQAGVVTYATDIRSIPTADGMMLSYSQNMDAARSYMNARHQPLATTLQAGKFQTMPLDVK